ncbi:MAG: aminotransferase class IV, partial [bacterium]
DADWRKAHEEGYFDLIYLNTDGEVTEGAITNLIANINGRWFTPPLRCGLLPGIWRAQRLKQGDVEERVLTREDLLRAARLVMGNSVRGDVEVSAIMQAGRDDPVWLCESMRA